MSGYGGRRATNLTELVYATYEPVCHLCLKPIADNERSVDHVIPRSMGGTDELSNCRPSHQRCNSARGNRSIEEFRASVTDEVAWLLGLE